MPSLGMVGPILPSTEIDKHMKVRLNSTSAAVSESLPGIYTTPVAINRRVESETEPPEAEAIHRRQPHEMRARASADIMPDMVEESSAKPIRVFLVDDHPLVRKGMVAILENESDIQITGEAEDVDAAAAQIESARPDILLVDLKLGKSNGMDLLRHVQDRWVGMKTIVVSQHSPDLYAQEAEKAGAMGYVCKDDAATQIVQAVRAVYHGSVFFDS